MKRSSTAPDVSLFWLLTCTTLIYTCDAWRCPPGWRATHVCKGGNKREMADERLQEVPHQVTDEYDREMIDSRFPAIFSPEDRQLDFPKGLSTTAERLRTINDLVGWEDSLLGGNDLPEYKSLNVASRSRKREAERESIILKKLLSEVQSQRELPEKSSVEDLETYYDVYGTPRWPSGRDYGEDSFRDEDDADVLTESLEDTYEERKREELLREVRILAQLLAEKHSRRHRSAEDSGMS